VTLLSVLLAALISGAAAAALNRFMAAQFETETWLSQRWLQVPIAVVLGGLAGLAPTLIQQITYTVMAIASALLIVIDFGDYRLPDKILLPLYPLLAVGLTALAWTQNQWGALARAGIFAAGLFVFYFVMAIFSPDLGFGDVKLAGVIGGFLGWFGIAHVLAGFLLGWGSFAILSVILLLTKRITRKSSLPMGPYLIAGAVAGAFLGPVMFPHFA
jgi:leader peptidase (prepilin peptidase) / N-methyltransferase